MQGKKVEWTGDILKEGEYSKASSGIWFCCTPGGHIGNLGKHTVTEHEDGTITVSPSILVSAPHEGKQNQLWHGYLERGVWRAC
jgi:hypothetical protein